jgi:hypothetical protein
MPLYHLYYIYLCSTLNAVEPGIGSARWKITSTCMLQHGLAGADLRISSSFSRPDDQSSYLFGARLYNFRRVSLAKALNICPPNSFARDNFCQYIVHAYFHSLGLFCFSCYGVRVWRILALPCVSREILSNSSKTWQIFLSAIGQDLAWLDWPKKSRLSRPISSRQPDKEPIASSQRLFGKATIHVHATVRWRPGCQIAVIL